MVKKTKTQNKQICTLPVFQSRLQAAMVAPTSHENEEVPFMTGLHNSKFT